MVDAYDDSPRVFITVAGIANDTSFLHPGAHISPPAPVAAADILRKSRRE